MVTRTVPSPAVRGDARQRAQLLAGQIALLHAHGNGGVAGLLLLGHVGLPPRVVSGSPVRWFTTGSSAPLPSGCGCDWYPPKPSGTISGQAIPPFARMSAIFLLDLLAQPLDAAFAQHEFQPRLVLVAAGCRTG